MKFVPNQCKACPFRPTSAPGWLGDYTAGAVFSSIWKGLPFFCHTSINYRNKNWEARAMSSGKLCTGGLLFAHKIMAPESQIQHEPIRIARLKVLDIKDKIVCMEPREFGEHHQPLEMRPSIILPSAYAAKK